MSERKREKLQERLDQPPERVAFSIVRDSRCSECGAELDSGDFLSMEGDQPLCLARAGPGDLEHLERGDAALTRRATKYSSRTAVVVRFSKSRGRYERQGILVEESALAKAEDECAEDSEARAIAAHAAVRGSGRIGRTAAGRELDEHAITLAVVAAVRHRHTGYGDLLAGGLDRAFARERVSGRVDEILAAWRKPAK